MVVDFSDRLAVFYPAGVFCFFYSFFARSGCSVVRPAKRRRAVLFPCSARSVSQFAQEADVWRPPVFLVFSDMFYYFLLIFMVKTHKNNTVCNYRFS